MKDAAVNFSCDNCKVAYYCSKECHDEHKHVHTTDVCNALKAVEALLVVEKKEKKGPGKGRHPTASIGMVSFVDQNTNRMKTCFITPAGQVNVAEGVVLNLYDDNKGSFFEKGNFVECYDGVHVDRTGGNSWKPAAHRCFFCGPRLRQFPDMAGPIPADMAWLSGSEHPAVVALAKTAEEGKAVAATLAKAEEEPATGDEDDEEPFKDPLMHYHLQKWLAAVRGTPAAEKKDTHKQQKKQLKKIDIVGSDNATEGGCDAGGGCDGGGE